MQFAETERLRLVQDGVETSLIGGYHMRVRVPAKHHLRLYGKSARCSFPTNSVLSKWTTPSMLNRTTPDIATTSSIKIATRKLTLNQDAFKKNCTYLFDVSEPLVASGDLFADKSTDSWEASWFLKFDSPFDLYDFELNWKFVKNMIVDETKSLGISLPKENSFESIDRDLIYIFK